MNKKIFIRKNGTKAVQTVYSKNNVDKTDQQYAEESDVNFILNRFAKTGQLPNNIKSGIYADISDSPTFSEAMQLLTEGNNTFEQLDPLLKKRFPTPQVLMDFLDNPENDVEAVKLGLKEYPQKPEIPTVKIFKEESAANDDQTTKAD